MLLEFIKPGSTSVGVIADVKVENRKGNSILEIYWDTQGQQIRESHFMTNYDEIVESLGKIGLDINTDTDTWLGTAAELLIESNNGYLNATIVGPAEVKSTVEATELDLSTEATTSAATDSSVAGLLDD